MIPLMTRRSSTLGLPRVSLGRCGLRRANCSSLSQKASRSINGLPSETLRPHILGCQSCVIPGDHRRADGLAILVIGNADHRHVEDSRMRAQDILMARLDRLGPTAKEVAQV